MQRSLVLTGLMGLAAVVCPSVWACEHPNKSTTPRLPHVQLKLDVASAIKDSVPLNVDTREKTVQSLVGLHHKISDDPDLTQIDRVELLGKLNGRLRQISGALLKEIAGRHNAKKSLRAEQSPTQVVVAKTDSINRPANSPSTLSVATNLVTANQMAAQNADANQIAAQLRGRLPVAPNARFGNGNFGANNRGNGAGGIAAQNGDNGPALVALIQKTIAPDSWDVNGGPGAVVYYGQSRALVVRQRAEVHEQLDGVIRGLRQ